MVGGRDGEYALALMDDLRGRLANKVPLTTDGHKAYLQAVEDAFGTDIDYAMLMKLYGAAPATTDDAAGRRYSPAECVGIRKETIPASPIRSMSARATWMRSNLSIRMHNRRFARLTNAHSKKLENHIWGVALHVIFYNFVRIHSTLRTSPATTAGIADRLWDMTDTIATMEMWETPPKRPATYRKRETAVEISN